MKFSHCIVLFCTLLSVISCDKNRVFDDYKTLKNGWHKDSTLTFDLPVIDSTKFYDLFLNIRNNQEYEFNNLFVIVSMEQPKGVIKVDTLEYEMADPEGNLLGEGFSDIKESKLYYKENFKFSSSGQYRVKIRQASRKNGKISGVENLEGVTEVGFRVESKE